MPRLKWLMFQMPMSSPQRIRMFGCLVAIVLAPWCGAVSPDDRAVPHQDLRRERRIRDRHVIRLSLGAIEPEGCGTLVASPRRRGAWRTDIVPAATASLAPSLHLPGRDDRTHPAAG